MARCQRRASLRLPCSATSIVETKAATVKQQRWRTISFRCGGICEIKLVFCLRATHILALYLRCEPFMPDPTTPFSFWYDLGGLSEAGAEVTLSPTAAERAAISHWLGIEALDEEHVLACVPGVGRSHDVAPVRGAEAERKVQLAEPE